MDNSDLEKGLLAGGVAFVGAIAMWLRHLLWSKIERTIDERIRKHLTPLIKQVQDVALDCHDMRGAFQGMSSTFERLEGTLGDNIGKLASAIEKLSEKVADQGKELSNFQGRWEEKDRRSGVDDRRRRSPKP